MPRACKRSIAVAEGRDVGRVQADRGLVEDVEHVDEVRAECGGERNALCFAIAQRAERAVDCNVADADIGEKDEAGANIREQRSCDSLLPVWQDSVRRRT